MGRGYTEVQIDFVTVHGLRRLEQVRLKSQESRDTGTNNDFGSIVLLNIKTGT